MGERKRKNYKELGIIGFEEKLNEGCEREVLEE